GEYVLADQFDELIIIRNPLQQRIIELIGITDQLIQTYGKEEQVVAKEFHRRFLENKENTLFIAYNAHFDIGFIGKMLSRHGLSLPNMPSYLDALTVFKDRVSYPHRLENAIGHYNLEYLVKNSHRAIDDVKATFEVVKAMSLENDNLNRYINLFGYNPKYPITNKVKGVEYRPQSFGNKKKLYE
ncbi:MAG: exonuclease domain-containing protein, partial [Bacilli bacterium]|nr:exonuclease domain-containing protein [Bacilli bacterium]